MPAVKWLFTNNRNYTLFLGYLSLKIGLPNSGECGRANTLAQGQKKKGFYLVSTQNLKMFALPTN